MIKRSALRSPSLDPTSSCRSGRAGRLFWLALGGSAETPPPPDPFVRRRDIGGFRLLLAHKIAPKRPTSGRGQINGSKPKFLARARRVQYESIDAGQTDGNSFGLLLNP